MTDEKTIITKIQSRIWDLRYGEVQAKNLAKKALRDGDYNASASLQNYALTASKIREELERLYDFILECDMNETS